MWHLVTVVLLSSYDGSCIFSIWFPSHCTQRHDHMQRCLSWRSPTTDDLPYGGISGHHHAHHLLRSDESRMNLGWSCGVHQPLLQKNEAPMYLGAWGSMYKFPYSSMWLKRRGKWGPRLLGEEEGGMRRSWIRPDRGTSSTFHGESFHVSTALHQPWVWEFFFLRYVPTRYSTRKL